MFPLSKNCPNAEVVLPPYFANNSASVFNKSVPKYTYAKAPPIISNTKLTVLLSELFEPGYGEVFLYDLQGRLLLSQDVTSIRTILQLDSFVSGTYLLKLVFGSRQSIWKIIKE